MNKQEFLEQFKLWRAKNGYPKRQACRDIYKQYLTAEYIDSEEFEWCYYISKQDKPSIFLDSLFVKGSEVTKNDPINSTDNRPKEDDIKQEIIDIFYNFVKENNFIPEFKDLNYNSNIKKYFKTEKELYNACSDKYNLSEFSLNESLFTDKYFEGVLDKVSKYNKFVITTAVVGKKVDKEFINSIKNYCNRNNALCLVMPCQDTFNRKSGFEYQLDPELKDFCIVYKDLYLNENIYLSSIKVSAKQIQPITGIHQFTTEASCILASPQQNMMPIPNQFKKIPHVIMCSGACTIPDYNNDLYMSHRLNKIAEYNHINGAVIIEIENKKIFHFRQIQSGNNGEFIDLSIQYNPDNTISYVDDSYMVIGDAHFGEHEEAVLDKTKEMVKDLGVTDLALHDVFGGYSIAHWDVNKTITRAIKAEEGKLSLLQEAHLCARKLMEFGELISGKVDIVYSNHPLFLERYLEDGRYAKDPLNLYYSLDIVKAFLNKINPFKYMICNKTDFVYLDDKDFEKFNFLEKLDDKQVYGIEIAQHGSFGAGGAKGSLIAYKKAFEKSISAHTHFPCINGGAWSVGTNSVLDPNYARGISNSMHTNAIIYKNGTRQLINIIKNKDGNYTWRL